jgi:hypothetical protein
MKDQKFSVTIPCEIKSVASKKLASLDIEYRLVLDTADPAVLQLGALPSELLFDVTVEAQS